MGVDLAGPLEELAWPLIRVTVMGLISSYAGVEFGDSSTVSAAVHDKRACPELPCQDLSMCQGLRQVLVLPPALEERLLTLIRKRILPAALKCLRVWMQGDVHCRLHPHRLCVTVVMRYSSQGIQNRNCVAKLCGISALGPCFARRADRQARSTPAGKGLIVGSIAATEIVTGLLRSKASLHIIPDTEDRLRALRNVCSAMPYAAQALFEQVRQLCWACADMSIYLDRVLPAHMRSDGRLRL